MGKKPFVNTIHYEKPWVNTMGKKTLDHPINTLWRFPDHNFYIPEIFHFPSHSSRTLYSYVFLHTILRFTVSSLYVTFDPFPGENDCCRKSETQIVGSMGLHPQMVALAHLIERYVIFLFY